MATLDVDGFIYGFIILILPLILALPMRLAWQIFVGSGHEASEYKQNVRQIIDSGHQVSAFRDALDDICLLYTSPSPRDVEESRMPSSA